MNRIQRSAMVPYTAAEMYQLVTDIDEYQSFLPWCGGSKVLESSRNQVTAEVYIDFKGLKKRFVTVNQNTPPQKIEMNLKEGPFQSLHGEWVFRNLNPSASQVKLDIQFEFAGIIMEKLMAPVFSAITGTMVESFTARAEQVYGKRKLHFS